MLANGNPATADLDWAPGLGLIGNAYFLEFVAVDSLCATTRQILEINIKPESTSFALLVLGALAVVRRR